MKRIAGSAAVLLLALVGVGAGAAPASAVESRPTVATADVPPFESFSAEYYLSRDAEGHSHMRVVETIVALYPDYEVNKGFYRDIPKFYQEMPLTPTVVSVSDENGRAVPYAVEDYDAGDGLDYKYTSIALGDDSYVTGRKTYVIEYTLDNVIHHADDADVDELYWDVNGADTGSPIGPVSVVVHLDDDLVDGLNGDAACYPGYYAAEQGCVVQRSADGTEFSTSVGQMSAYDTLTIAIGFQPGTFTPGERLSDNWIVKYLPPLLFGLALLTFIVACIVRAVLWRDAAGRGTIIAQYSVPENHDILLAADVIERGHEALAAAFVDLAVRRYVDVIDLDPADPDDDDRFALEFRSRDGATAQELTLLKALFDDFEVGERVRLGALGETEGAALYAMGLRARDRSIAAGLRAKPTDNWATVLNAVKWPLILGFGAVFLWCSSVELDAGPVFGWLVVSVIAFFATGAAMSKPYRLTTKGAELRDYLVGMKVYLDLAEEDRMRVLQSPDGAERVNTADRGLVVKLNEKLLPYAVLWDVERDWAKELEVEYTAAAVQPGWISSDLASVDLGRTLSSFSRGSISSVRPIVPVAATSSGGGGGGWSGGSSSFSSGSRGGGFSGGGGGGGGMRGR